MLPAATHLFVLARDNSGDNPVKKIPCRSCTALTGMAYDNINDCFCVDCVEYCDLGNVPISVTISLGGWKKRIPVPEKLLIKHFTESQLMRLNQFKSYFDPKRFSFSFLQAIEL
jgi:hypothetical protein